MVQGKVPVSTTQTGKPHKFIGYWLENIEDSCLSSGEKLKYITVRFLYYVGSGMLPEGRL